MFNNDFWKKGNKWREFYNRFGFLLVELLSCKMRGKSRWEFGRIEGLKKGWGIILVEIDFIVSGKRIGLILLR